MYRPYQLPRLHTNPQLYPLTSRIRLFSRIPSTQAHQSPNQGRNTPTPTPSINKTSIFNPEFWSCASTWKRARLNTLRCLLGCTIGDFSAMWTLQSFYPELGTNTTMLASMASGIATSIILETVLLKRGADGLSWSRALRTAMGMSMVSMIAMEVAENAVDYHLTGGRVVFDDPRFWLAAGLSVGAGFLAPLPYNYLRLRRYGKACH